MANKEYKTVTLLFSTKDNVNNISMVILAIALNTMYV